MLYYSSQESYQVSSLLSLAPPTIPCGWREVAERVEGWGEALAGSFFSHLDFWYKTRHPCFSTVFSVFSSNNRTTLFLFLGNILADILAQRLRDILQASGNINISAEYIVLLLHFKYSLQFIFTIKRFKFKSRISDNKK